MRGIILLFAIVISIALAGYVLRESNKPVSNALFFLAAVFLIMLVLGLTRLA